MLAPYFLRSSRISAVCPARDLSARTARTSSRVSAGFAEAIGAFGSPATLGVPPNCYASQSAASLIAAAAFLSSSIVIAISFIFDICCSSFLGLSLCGDDSEILRHSCGYLTDCCEGSNYFCVSIVSVVKGLIHGVHLAFCRSLCFALHYSMEVRWPFGRKNIESF